MDWSIDEKYFYHTDSDTNIIKEYAFNKIKGEISPTGRSIFVGGDGFTIDKDNRIYAACWGYGHIAVIDTAVMDIVDYIDIPAKIPASCAFCGHDMKELIIVTASYGSDITEDVNAGYLFIEKRMTSGRIHYLFGQV